MENQIDPPPQISWYRYVAYACFHPMLGLLTRTIDQRGECQRRKNVETENTSTPNTLQQDGFPPQPKGGESSKFSCKIEAAPAVNI